MLVLTMLGTLAGCSVRQYATRNLADALAASGSTFTSDDDPELIRQSTPFSLKLMESVLEDQPRHRGLLLAASSGFTRYAYAFVQEDADEAESRDLSAATALRLRARKLFLRARNYGLRGLEVRHEHFARELRADQRRAVADAQREDVPLLYWTAAAWGSAIALAKDDPELIADQPVVEALIDRALQLNPSFDDGAIHSFLITYEMSRQGTGADSPARARQHFDEAVRLTNGQLAAPFVSFAEAVCVRQQNRAEFESMLRRAIAIDPDARPQWRLMNLIMQRRARWLLSRVGELFVE